MPLSPEVRETSSTRHLRSATADLLATVNSLRGTEPWAYEITEARLDWIKSITRDIEAELRNKPEELRVLQDWFRRATDLVFRESWMMHRVRAWPEGYPGDYVTLEALYANVPRTTNGIGSIIDRYLFSRTLAVAVRSRLRKLTDLLNERAVFENGSSNWLNIACGACRELVSIPPRNGRVIRCIDTDQNALDFAERLIRITHRDGERIEFVRENAFRLSNARRNIERFGPLTTIYSTGLFDYIKTEQLTRFIAHLYDSLAPGGALITSFKDKSLYDTFDYHWLTKWDHFFQRSVDEVHDIFTKAGVPGHYLTTERDDSGVIVFFIAGRSGVGSHGLLTGTE
jgi:hypothetical protein